MGVDRGERGGLSVFNLSLYLVQETPAGVERSPTTSEAKLETKQFHSLFRSGREIYVN